MTNPFSWIVGEISKLRAPSFGQYGWVISSRDVYSLDTSRVDYTLARELYHNTNDEYKLGAGFAKPIINTLAGFMGAPRFRCVDEEAKKVLDDYSMEWTSKMLRVHQLTLRDGDCFVYLYADKVNNILYPEREGTAIDFVIIPPEQVADIVLDPVTHKPIGYVIQSQISWDEGRRRYTYTQYITPEIIEVSAQGDVPEGVKVGQQPNPWGFIPIIHFKNEPEETQLFGTSELEAVEPYLKAYHDVMLHAMQGSKLHSTPRMKLQLRDVAGFLKNNFPDAWEDIQQGRPARLDLTGHELLIFTDEEDASFIEVRSAIGDAATLLKLLFYCIVDVSEVPEFVFGVHTPSSHASVSEQAPLLIRRVARKREMVTENWIMFARMVLAMYSRLTGKRFADYTVTITWDEVIERDERQYAETINTLTNALNVAVMGGFMSIDAAVDLLSQYVDTMSEYVSDNPEIPGEREKIIKSWILRQRLEQNAGFNRQLEEMTKAIEEAENELA